MTISAKIIADSISATGKRITSFELEYPRFIHSEFMTHRLFSRNAASSRAIPVPRAIELIRENTAMPVHWGKNQPGMSAKEECEAMMPHDKFPDPKAKEIKAVGLLTKYSAWERARDLAIECAEQFNTAGFHKQIVNRLLEPFTHMKTILTATEFENWFTLRNHEDAQPEIHELAAKMLIEYEKSIPYKLGLNWWHVPYYEEGHWEPEYNWAFINRGIDSETTDALGNTLSDAISISSSCCAQVSYRRLDDSLEKAKSIYARLITATPCHMSPFEHQATPIQSELGFSQSGVTHMDRSKRFWSGNFCGWVQNRQLIMLQMNLQPMTSAT